MDTPRSEKSQTRYSTPEPDLDDHRHQPESLPPAPATENYFQARRGTLASIVDGERPPVPRLALPVEMHGSIARDFENAVVDDDRSIKSNRSRKSNNIRSPDEEWHRERRMHHERRGTGSPIPARRTTFRRPGNAEGDADSIRSNASSGSTSPPNSVDAFAPPNRRGRSGTINSKAPSTAGSVHRTASNATHPRRRPTFGEEDGIGRIKSDVASHRSSAIEDVCFPPEDPPNTYTIDFEDLEEFVAETHTKTPVAHPFMPQFPSKSTGQRVFNDQRGGSQSNNYFTGLHQNEKDEKENGVSSDESDGLKQVASTVELPLNRWTFFSSEIDETIHAPELGGLLMPGETFRDIFELGPEGGVWWLDMLNPSEEEIFAICSAFRVHPLTREDITTQETREKVELFKTYYFLCFRSCYMVDPKHDDYLEPINIYAVVFREGLLTFSFCPNNHAATVRKRIGRLRDYVNLSADWICYALIDEIVDSFAPVLRELEQETDTIEDSVFTARFEDSRAMLQGIGDCRKRIMALTRLLGGKADVIKSFAKKCNESYAVAPRGDVGLYLSDVQDHIVTMMSNLGHFEKMLSRSHTNHLTQITLQHTEQGSRANELLGKITVLATILVPMNLVAGLFGMNVEVPGMHATGLGWWFGIVGVVFGLAVTCVTLAKKFKYI
ncbi:Putative Mg2+ transporter protein, CorA-like/Zinc transport protein ZntB [Septoria linicola]|uniref:Mg2+ transporter protein, CorA-like/Zinc transport protein ZntB n=1 Tax=Septoria linicola TaxID=215465 RepID=A0A9Q9AMF7_9PEZI|nr:putative Mg2+ transporter protein, CorA-like/Zinc transport protein ZntB [Septoria linicola]USW51665.1 Putative Mg2+ transporter protein, CorA-like/Zinc transport protein ZntB [Septoria linicola]